MKEGRMRLGFIAIVAAVAAIGCDQPTMKSIEANYGARGVSTIEVVVEGGYGIAATENDISRWAATHMLSGTIVIDPGYALSQYADVTAFPVYLVVRASTMKIEYM